MIIVIADDITGAAEIAGIAKSAGYETRLLMTGEGVMANDNLLVGDDMEADVVVFATDTRQMSEADAVKDVEGLVKMIYTKVLPSTNNVANTLLFKKTDSVLRGHIKAECDAIVANTDYEQVLLVPQNPSKGRVVRNGLYYIDNVLLNETQFANDPEFPAKTADVSLFGVPDAESIEQIAGIVKVSKPNTLFAGGADLFKAVLYNTKHLTLNTKSDDLIHNLATTQPYDLKSSKPQNLIMVCGSTQSKRVVDTPLCRRYNAMECNMPESVFLGKEGAESWLPSLKKVFATNGVVLTINYPSQGGKDFAVRLRKTMAQTVKALADDCFESLGISPDSQVKRTLKNAAAQPCLKLIIEGGATAFEILATLGWSTFDVMKEHFPGVVEIANEYASIVLKPGSYPWRGLLDE